MYVHIEIGKKSMFFFFHLIANIDCWLCFYASLWLCVLPIYFNFFLCSQCKVFALFFFHRIFDRFFETFGRTYNASGICIRKQSGRKTITVCAVHWNEWICDRIYKKKTNQDRLFWEQRNIEQKKITTTTTTPIQKAKIVNSFVEFLSFSRFLRQFQIFHLIFLAQNMSIINTRHYAVHWFVIYV